MPIVSDTWKPAGPGVIYETLRVSVYDSYPPTTLEAEPGPALSEYYILGLASKFHQDGRGVVARIGVPTFFRLSDPKTRKPLYQANLTQYYLVSPGDTISVDLNIPHDYNCKPF